MAQQGEQAFRSRSRQAHAHMPYLAHKTLVMETVFLKAILLSRQ